ncbi:MAG: hypothetical protein AW12_01727 [Candidatus Accumulibacter sp. BA-94]|nr:MAG: hypothetical protein AW12_01727 [Candidatus Accumulibacter sp. BA-94]
MTLPTAPPRIMVSASESRNSPLWRGRMLTIQAAMPIASAVKNQRCQPPASERKLNAAPGLNTSTQLKNGAT